MNLAEAYLAVSEKLPIDDIKVKQRLDRAYEIINSPGYEVMHLGNYLFEVHKASTSLFDDTSVYYEVTAHKCTCPDFETARGNMCKHRLAILMWIEMNKG